MTRVASLADSTEWRCCEAVVRYMFLLLRCDGGWQAVGTEYSGTDEASRVFSQQATVMSRIQGLANGEGGVGDEVVGWEGNRAFKSAVAVGKISMRLQYNGYCMCYCCSPETLILL